jgi:fructosamine-3-kinase
LEQAGYGRIVSFEPVRGGCINHGSRIQTSTGANFFLKTNLKAPADMFAREAEGLAALRQPGGPRIPQAHVWGEDFILLEYLHPAAPMPGFWVDFGHALARLHGYTNTQFGFENNNYLGSTPQLNPWTSDGFIFLASGVCSTRPTWLQKLACFRQQMAG